MWYFCFMSEQKLLIPIQGAHVCEALATARTNQDDFCNSEMDWLKDNNPAFKEHTEKLFDALAYKHQDRPSAEAMLTGNLLGNHAVRLCTAETDSYLKATENYHINRNLDRLRWSGPVKPQGKLWDNEDILMNVFGDEDLAGALLEIKHDFARAAASSTIGYFCLLEMPRPTSVSV